MMFSRNHIENLGRRCVLGWGLARVSACQRILELTVAMLEWHGFALAWETALFADPDRNERVTGGGGNRRVSSASRRGSNCFAWPGGP